MKLQILSLGLLLGFLDTAAHAQQIPAGRVAPPTEPSATAPAATKPEATLTNEQVTKVLEQLTDLEKQILQIRGNNLSGILTRLRTAMASDAAAMNLYLECDRVVNSERKEMDKVEARKRQEAMEKNANQRPKGGGGGGGGGDEGDTSFAIRLGIHYMVLTLEAAECKEEDLKKMVPKLQDYIQTLTATAPKIKGRAQGYLAGALSDRNPIVQAFSLSRYLNGNKNWSNSPLNIGAFYTATLLPIAEKESVDSLPALWDARINAEGIMRKEQMFAPEFELWTVNELPVLRWQRAQYLYQKGPSPVNAMADMLKLIRENTNHVDAPKWVEQLRGLVNQAAIAKEKAGAPATDS